MTQRHFAASSTSSGDSLILQAIIREMSVMTTAAALGPVIPSASKKKVRRDSPFFTEDNKEKIGDLLENVLRAEKAKKDGEMVELEARLGRYEKRFIPGVQSLYVFNILKNILDTTSGFKPPEEVNDLVEILQNQKKGTILDEIRRVIHLDDDDDDDEKIEFERKTTIFRSIDNREWGVRISAVKEQFMKGNKISEKFEKEWVKATTSTTRSNRPIALQRNKRRFSYDNDDPKSVFSRMRVDITIVIEKLFFGAGASQKNVTYEVELEKLDEQKITPENFTAAIIQLVKWTQGFEKLKDTQLIDEKEKVLAIKAHNALVKGSERSKFRISGRYINKPRNIKLTNMLQKDFDPYVTVKLDGRRRFLFIDKRGIYTFSEPYDIFKVGDAPEGELFSLVGTLIDCEHMTIEDENINTIFGFDLLFYKGRDIRKEPFSERLRLLQTIGPLLGKNSSLFWSDFKVKQYFFSMPGSSSTNTGSEFYERTKAAFALMEDTEGVEKYNDGLIFQPNNKPYKNQSTFKWKEPHNLTIDFLFVPIEGGYELHVAGGPTGSIWFKGSGHNPYSGVIYSDDHRYAEQVVECRWVEGSKERESTFEPVRVRDDRVFPNYVTVANSVWNDIHNPITKTTIEGYTLQLMRRYHNITKDNMLRGAFRSGDVIVDIGSGRGGDLSKWNNLKLKKVFAIEPNDDNFAEFQRRYDLMKKEGFVPKIQRLSYGAEETAKIRNALKDKNTKLNGIVSFASLTFFPKSKTMYDRLLATLNLLPPGGKFIGIVMDGERVRQLLTSEKEYKAFSITKVKMTKSAVFGNKIRINISDETSMVKEQEEWLFNFQKFKDALVKLGIELVSDEFLDHGEEYSHLSSDAQAFSKLNRKFVFRRPGGVEKKETIIKPKSKEEIALQVYNLTPSQVEKGVSLFKKNVDLLSQIQSIREPSHLDKKLQRELVRDWYVHTAVEKARLPEDKIRSLLGLREHMFDEWTGLMLQEGDKIPSEEEILLNYGSKIRKQYFDILKDVDLKEVNTEAANEFDELSKKKYDRQRQNWLREIEKSQEGLVRNWYIADQIRKAKKTGTTQAVKARNRQIGVRAAKNFDRLGQLREDYQNQKDQFDTKEEYPPSLLKMGKDIEKLQKEYEVRKKAWADEVGKGPSGEFTPLTLQTLEIRHILSRI